MYPFVRFREAAGVRERDEEDTDNDDPYDDDPEVVVRDEDEDPEVVVRDEDEDPEVVSDTDADGLRRCFFAWCRFAPLCSYLPLFVVFLEPVCFRGTVLASRLGTSTGCVVGRIRTRGRSVNARDGAHEDERG